jgi:predicted permease
MLNRSSVRKINCWYVWESLLLYYFGWCSFVFIDICDFGSIWKKKDDIKKVKTRVRKSNSGELDRFLIRDLTNGWLRKQEVFQGIIPLFETHWAQIKGKCDSLIPDVTCSFIFDQDVNINHNPSSQKHLNTCSYARLA